MAHWGENQEGEEKHTYLIPLSHGYHCFRINHPPTCCPPADCSRMLPETSTPNNSEPQSTSTAVSILSPIATHCAGSMWTGCHFRHCVHLPRSRIQER